MAQYRSSILKCHHSVKETNSFILVAVAEELASNLTYIKGLTAIFPRDWEAGGGQLSTLHLPYPSLLMLLRKELMHRSGALNFVALPRRHIP